MYACSVSVLYKNLGGRGVIEDVHIHYIHYLTSGVQLDMVISAVVSCLLVTTTCSILHPIGDTNMSLNTLVIKDTRAVRTGGVHTQNSLYFLIFTSRPVCDIWLFAAKEVVVY